MRSPAIALLWECWRLSRRWYLWVLPAAIALNLALMNLSGIVKLPPPMLAADPTLGLRIVALFAFTISFMLAIFATFMAMALGGKAGFPLQFEYRLPVGSAVLIAVPMALMAVLCASLYVIPVTLNWLIYGVAFPLLPVCAVLMTLAVALLTSSWATTSTPSRLFALVVAVVGYSSLFSHLAPMHFPGSDPRHPAPPALTPDIMIMTPGGYAELAAACLLLFGITLASLRRQRCSESPLPGLSALLPARSGTASSWSVSALRDRIADLVALPCPVQSRWRAELWLELKRHTLPILLIGALIALIMPLHLLGNSLGNISTTWLDYLFLATVFLTGTGIAIFNRRSATGGYMSAFEGTRRLSTPALALIQVLALAASILAGMLLVCTSLYLSSRLLDQPSVLTSLFSAAADETPLQLFSDIIVLLTLYLAAIMLFVCVHVCSIVWGRIFPYGIGALALYGIIFSFLISHQNVGLQGIQRHMWGFAAAVLLLTLLVLGRTLQLKILTLPSALAGAAVWVVFVVCGVYSLAQRGIVLADQPSELQAFNASLLLLPLTFFLALNWCYDRLRHR
ncbi:MAG TPA: hypothetical protein VMH83_05655 [Candidatus Acidoferrum sp.]|nr:hypothetical protein [Candidatus Acidoferrum sp.]